MAFQFVGTIHAIHSVSDKLIEQYEERIQEQKALIKELREEIKNFRK